MSRFKPGDLVHFKDDPEGRGIVIKRCKINNHYLTNQIEYQVYWFSQRRIMTEYHTWIEKIEVDKND